MGGSLHRRPARRGHGALTAAYGIAVERPIEGVVVVALTGEHDLASRDELREEVEQALTTGRGLVVDLTRASFIDSVIAAVLLEARKTAKRHDLGLAVLLSDDPSNDVRRMFELSRLTTIFEIFPSRAEAISAVRGGFVQSA